MLLERGHKLLLSWLKALPLLSWSGHSMAVLLLWVRNLFAWEESVELAHSLRLLSWRKRY
jgi:hypothetical protein